MKSSVNKLLGEAQQKISGHTALLNYRLMDLCIEAEPVALLTTVVDYDSEEYHLEDVADVAIPNEKQFAITPHDPVYVFPICKAIKLEHPEFDIDTKNEASDEEEEEVVIYCTMPEMNDERHDACVEYVKAVSKDTQTNVEAIFSVTSAKIVILMAGDSEESIEEAKNKLQEIYDWSVGTCEKLRADKEKEIEDAYKLYVEAENAKKLAKEEERLSKGEEIGFSMKMGEEE